jgi:hypothetical protein
MSAFSPEAFDFIVADYARSDRPSLVSCYRRLVRTARDCGWSVPSYATVARKLNAYDAVCHRVTVGRFAPPTLTRRLAARGIAALLEMQALGEVPVSFGTAGA